MCEIISLPSYLKVLGFNEEKIKLLYRNNISSTKNIKRSSGEKVYENMNRKLENLDLTGTPLEVDLGSQEEDDNNCSFGGELFKVWGKAEELQAPYALTEAQSILNKQYGCTNTRGVLVYCLCNGLDDKKTILLGLKSDYGNFFRSLVCVQKCVSSIDENILRNILDEHNNLEETTSDREDNILVTSVLELYERPIINLKTNDITTQNGSVSLEINWKEPTYKIPHSASVNLQVQVIIGHDFSKLSKLWDEILLLKKCIVAIESNKSGQEIGSFELNENYKSAVELDENIIDLVMNNTYIKEEKENRDSNLNKILENLDNIFERDVLSNLFLILKDCKNVQDLIGRCYTFFEQSMRPDTNIKIPSKNKTQVANICRSVKRNTFKWVELYPYDALQVLLEIGIEKLMNDYANIFSTLQYESQLNINNWEKIVESMYDSKQDGNIQSNVFQPRQSYYPRTTASTSINDETWKSCSKIYPADVPVGKYYAKLCFLGRLQLTLENLQFIYSYCDLPQELYNLVVEKIVNDFINAPTISSFEQLLSTQMYTWKTKLPVWNVNKLNQVKPTTWRFKIRSKKIDGITESIYNFSIRPIFPPTLFQKYELPEDSEDEYYYVTKMLNLTYDYGV